MHSDQQTFANKISHELTCCPCRRCFTLNIYLYNIISIYDMCTCIMCVYVICNPPMSYTYNTTHTSKHIQHNTYIITNIHGCLHVLCVYPYVYMYYVSIRAFDVWFHLYISHLARTDLSGVPGTEYGSTLQMCSYHGRGALV